jgi:hypothetical protein
VLLSNSRSKECNWCLKHSPGTAFGQIWTQYKELNAHRDENVSEIVGPVEEVANNVSSNSYKWIVITGGSIYMTPDKNCFKCFFSVRGNVVLAIKNHVEYTGIGSNNLSCHLAIGYISVVLLHPVCFVPSVQKSLYSWNSLSR